MHYALIRPRKGSASDSSSRSSQRPRQTAPVKTEQTVAERLNAKAGGSFSAEWLAQELGCPVGAAAELAGYWIPQGPPHLLEQTLNVFANALDLNATRLQDLLRGVPVSYGAAPQAPRAPRSAAPHAASHHAAPRKPAAGPRLSAGPRPDEPAQAEISIGSSEGVRVVKQRQPTIVYRKTRKVPATAGQS